MKKILFILIMLLFVINALGQRTISGVVSDYANKPISGAEVSIFGTTLKTFTQKDGKYSIVVPDNLTKLQITKNKYSVKFVEITSNEINVTLEDSSNTNLLEFSLEELMNLTVSTAGKKTEVLSKIPASVVVFQRDEIAKIGYKSVENILQDILGMYMIDDYGWTGTKNYGVRGFYSNGSFSNMVVLVNGVDQRSDALFEADMTEKFEIPIEAIDRIEVVRGPMSVIYGSGAFFGAINIITNQESETDVDNKVAVSLGNFESGRAFVQFKGHGQDFRYSLHASMYKDNGIDVPFGDLMSDPSIATKSVADGGWNLTSDRTKGLLYTNRKSMNFNGQFRNITTNFGLISSQKGSSEFTFGAGDGHSVHYLSSYGSMQYEQKLSDIINLRAKFDVTSDNHWVDDNFYFATGAANNISRINAYDFEVTTTINPNANFNMMNGFNTRYVNDYMVLVDYPVFGYSDQEWFSDDVQTFSFFSQANYSITSNLDIVAGFRIENSQPYTISQSIPDSNRLITPTIRSYSVESANKFDFVPRLAVIYSINDNNVLKLLFGQAIKQPSITSQFDMIGTNRILKSSNIHTYEINFQTIIATFFSINASVFYNDLNNLISRTNILDDEGNVSIISDNSGHNTTIGTEFGVKIKLVSNWIIDMKAIYQESKDKRLGYENMELAYSPHLLAYFNSIWTINNFNFSISGRYVDKMLSVWDSQYTDANQMPVSPPITALYKGRIGAESPLNFNLSANIRVNQVFNSNFYFNVNVNNLLNEKNYYPATLSNPQFDKGTLGFGRWFYTSIGYNF